MVVLVKDSGVVVDSNIDVLCILVVDCGMLKVIGHNTMPDGCSLPAKYTVTRRAGWGINVVLHLLRKQRPLEESMEYSLHDESLSQGHLQSLWFADKH